MNVLFLGTAAAEGWPALFCDCGNCERARAAGGKDLRTRASVLIDDSILVDLGPDAFGQMLTHGFRLSRLGGIVFTHAHEDHLTAGHFMFARPPFAHWATDQPMPIFGNEPSIAAIAKAIGTEDPAEQRDRFHVDLKRVAPFEPFGLAGCTITPLLAEHAAEQQCLFYMFEKAGRCFVLANDTGWFPEPTWAALRGHTIHAIALDCTNGQIDGRKYHLGVDGVIDAVKRLREGGQLAKDAIALATHFSHNGGLLHDQLEARLKPHGVLPAYDGMRIEF